MMSNYYSSIATSSATATKSKRARSENGAANGDSRTAYGQESLMDNHSTTDAITSMEHLAKAAEIVSMQKSSSNASSDSLPLKKRRKVTMAQASQEQASIPAAVSADQLVVQTKYEAALRRIVELEEGSLPASSTVASGANAATAAMEALLAKADPAPAKGDDILAQDLLAMKKASNSSLEKMDDREASDESKLLSGLVKASGTKSTADRKKKQPTARRVSGDKKSLKTSTCAAAASVAKTIISKSVCADTNTVRSAAQKTQRAALLKQKSDDQAILNFARLIF